MIWKVLVSLSNILTFRLLISTFLLVAKFNHFASSEWMLYSALLSKYSTIAKIRALKENNKPGKFLKMQLLKKISKTTRMRE